MQLKTVVLPAPFGPINAVILWRSAVNERPLTATTPPKRMVEAADSEDRIAAHPRPSLASSEEIALLCRKKTVGARWPIRPRGRQIIKSTIAMPNTSMRY